MVCGCVVLLPRIVPILFLFVLVFGVVRAQLCEHARNPRTPLRLPCCLLSLLFSSSLLSSCPAFLCVGMAVGDSPCVGVPSWHDCYG